MYEIYEMTIARNWNIDLTKALAMLLVIMQHAWSMLELDNPALGIVCGAYRAISTVGVPLFVFVSGALLLTRTPMPIVTFFKKRLNRVLIPFVLLALLVYVMSILTGAYSWWNGDVLLAVKKFIPSLLENKINVLHWFVHMLLVLYLFTPFLQYALHNFSKREIEGVLVVWVVGMLFRQYFPNMYILNFTSILWKYLGVYIAGYYISQYRSGDNRYMYVGIVLSLILAVTGALTDCAIHLGVPLTAIFLGMICLNIPTSASIPASIAGRFITNFSRYSYTTYLLHVLLIRAIYVVIENSIPLNLIPFVPIIITPCVIVIFYVLCWTYDRIKWLPNNLVGIG